MTFLTSQVSQVGRYICALTLLPTFVCVFLSLQSTVLAQDAETVLAVLDGVEITQTEVDKTITAKILPLQQQLYALRKVALENLITSRLLERESRRKRISIDELRRVLTNVSVTVTQEQVDAAFVQNESFFGSMSPDEAKARLRLDLENQQRMKAYRSALERLRQEASLVVDFYAAPALMAVDDGTSPSIGQFEAAITIVEFVDFECPFCVEVQPTIKQLLREFNGEVRLVFKNLPLEGHRNSLAIARAGYCANKQNRFWEYHDALFRTPDLTLEKLKNLAIEVGLDKSEFEKCSNSAESKLGVEKDIELARTLQITSTPSFIVNGTTVTGALSFDKFRQLVQQELNFRQKKVSAAN